MAKQRIGGCFAPPLTDELLARYRASIDTLPQRSPVRDALDRLYDCVHAWWQLPESAEMGKPHPVGVGTIVPLSQPLQDQLWDLIPWDGQPDDQGEVTPDELGEMAKLFDSLEVDACTRNSVKLDAWQKAVTEHITRSFFPEPGLLQRLTRALRQATGWFGLLGDAERTRLQAEFLKVQECRDAVTRALAAKHYGPVPRPVLELTPLRDCAHHLLWHVKELARDREPMTNDRL